MVLETPMGAITIELYWNHAPKTCRVRMSARTSQATRLTFARAEHMGTSQARLLQWHCVSPRD